MAKNQLPCWICLSQHCDEAVGFFLKGLVFRSPHLRCVPFKKCVYRRVKRISQVGFLSYGNQWEFKNESLLC